MKYWKGIVGTEKEGQCGMMEDNGIVPNSTQITKEEYDLYVAGLPVDVPRKLLKTLLKEKGVITQLEHDGVV